MHASLLRLLSEVLSNSQDVAKFTHKHLTHAYLFQGAEVFMLIISFNLVNRTSTRPNY